MDWTAIGLGLVTAGVMVFYITQPWWTQGWQAQAQPDANPEASLAGQREAILTALRDLEFDHAVNKVTEEDYAILRQTLLAKAAAAMNRSEEEQAAAQAGLSARIKAETLAARRNINDGQVILPPEEESRTCPSCSRIPLAGDLYCRGCGSELTPACPECGKTVASSDRFCVNCGVQLALAVAG